MFIIIRRSKTSYIIKYRIIPLHHMRFTDITTFFRFFFFLGFTYFTLLFQDFHPALDPSCGSLPSLESFVSSVSCSRKKEEEKKHTVFVLRLSLSVCLLRQQPNHKETYIYHLINYSKACTMNALQGI